MEGVWKVLRTLVEVEGVVNIKFCGRWSAVVEGLCVPQALW